MKVLIVTERRNNQGAMTNGIRAAMAMERIGHDVTIREHNQLKYDDLQKTDFILAFGTLLYLRFASQAKWIHDNKPPGVKFALWYFDACNPVFRHSRHKVGTMGKIAPYIDHLFMTDHSHPWEKYVKKYTQLMQGVDPIEYDHQVAGYENRKYDVMFAGTHMTIFSEREAMLKTISRRFSLKWIGAKPSGRIVGSDFFHVYQSAKVAFVPPPPGCVNDHYWSNRIYLSAGTGTPCVVGYTPGIEEHYTDGEEVLYFNNEKEMIEKIEMLISDPALRERIGTAGRKRTLTDHTYNRRCEKLIEEVINGY